jgi:hypothetical protein
MQTVPGGWLGIPSDDGRKVIVGNGFASLFDVASGNVTPIGGIDGGGLDALYGCGWHQGLPCFSQQELTGRRLVNGPVDPPVEQLVGVNPTVAVKAGHVLSSVGADHFHDGRLLTYLTSSPRWAVDDWDGTHYLYKETDKAPWPTIVARPHLAGAEWVSLEVLRLTDELSNARVFTDPATRHPWVFANTAAGARIYAPDGHVHALPPGESRGILRWKDGDLLVVTVLIDRNGEPVLLARTFPQIGPDDPAKQIRGMWFANLQHALTPDGDLFVGYFNGIGGQTFVETLPFDAPAAPFVWAGDTLEPLPSVLPAMLTGHLSSDPFAPGLMGGTGSGKPYLIEGFKQDGSPWLTPNERARVIFMDPQESHAPEVEERNGLLEQDRHGGWLGYYCDRPRFSDDVLATAIKQREAGRAVLLILRAYPTNNKDTSEAISERLRSDIDRFSEPFTFSDREQAAFRLTVCAPEYDQSGFWSTVDRLLVRKSLRAIARVLSDPRNAGKVSGLFFFGWNRPPVNEPIKDDVAAIVAAVPAPDVEAIVPLWTAPVAPAPPLPQPSTPVTKPPQKPVQKPKPSQTPKVAVAIGGGILAALLAFFKRKRS